jgi:crotonobetainyl-CoA:carnitine CoA-transferase CaiB-like acyl-CoA transferase
MKIEMPYRHSASGTVALVGSPIKMSRTPPVYKLAPPSIGEHSQEILEEFGCLLAAEEK